VEQSEDSIAVRSLIEHLAEALGLEKAEAVLESALYESGLIDREVLSPAECRKVLDQLTTEGGIIAITARVAKIKLLMARNM
jgi:hypothetical protein